PRAAGPLSLGAPHSRRIRPGKILVSVLLPDRIGPSSRPSPRPRPAGKGPSHPPHRATLPASPHERAAGLMEPRRPSPMAHLDVQLLEGRAVPGTLTITPRAEVISSDSYIVSLPSAPNVGLTTAQEHNGGVVKWTPGS